ncbi:MAG TPA: hypothetical protein VGV38_04860, partial [Pyrinomonadaceae bacterium]|nr:hypothetical protein [Pyrinomonadaceae bacterium]
EEECFAAEDWPEQVSLAEDDLIDDYLRGRLEPERRRRFEQNYLTTAARVERVRLAAALLRQVDEEASKANARATQAQPTWAERLRAFLSGQGWPVSAAAALALALVLLCVWWAFGPSRPEKNFVALTLTISGSARAGGTPSERAGGPQTAAVRLPSDAAGLRLTLTLPAQTTAEKYRVHLEDVNEKTILSEVAQRAGSSVSVDVPAGQLSPGQYALKLFALGADGSEQRVPGSYFFNVE